MKKAQKQSWKAMIIFLITAAVILAVVIGLKVTGAFDSNGKSGNLDAADGTYTGEADGFGGKIVASITIKNGAITDIKAVGDKETANLGSVAVEKIPAKVMETQSLDVDVVAGASVSSRAVLLAITNALAQAGLTPESLQGNGDEQGSVAKTDETLTVDVVVVGAGGAGMSAAITAKQAGKNVIIVEKMPYVGGNIIKATGGMNAAETHYQAEQQMQEFMLQPTGLVLVNIW